jgi:hydroxymethylbilane synthase
MKTVPRTRPVRLGSRRSALARAQADQVAAALSTSGIESSFVGITTAGDVDQRHLTEIGGSGVFVSAVRDALTRRNRCCGALAEATATASAEDLRSSRFQREDTRDVLVGCRLDDLTDGMRIGTGAPRREMQILDWAASRNLKLDRVSGFGATSRRGSSEAEGVVDAVISGSRRVAPTGVLGEPATTTGDLVVKQLPAQILIIRVMLPAPDRPSLEIHRSLSIEFRRHWQISTTSLRMQNPLVERAFWPRWRLVVRRRWGPMLSSKRSVVQVSI